MVVLQVINWLISDLFNDYCIVYKAGAYDCLQERLLSINSTDDLF